MRPLRDTARRSDLAGWAEYGYCASHSRYFWGLRLHLLATLHGLPIGFALTGAKADERQVLLSILDDPALSAGRAGQVIIADKHYYGREFEAALANGGFCLLRPAARASLPGPGPGSSSPCARSSSQSTTPSKASPASNDTAATPHVSPTK
jgi:Transposase DDE domain